MCFHHSATMSHDSPPLQASQHHNKAYKLTFFSFSIFSGSIDAAGSVTHSGLWGFFQTVCQ